jgi:hypothetical protein
MTEGKSGACPAPHATDFLATNPNLVGIVRGFPFGGIATKFATPP